MPIISLSINRTRVELELDPETPLLWALRDHLDLVGAKFGCGGGFCGACTVHVDGAATRSCTLPIGKAVGAQITTIEGLSGAGSPSTSLRAGREPGAEGSREPSALHPVQRAWAAIDVPQCGYCQAGQIMTAAALLARTPDPTDAQIDAAMNGNICRCGTYKRIHEAVRRAAEMSSRPSAQRGGER